MGSRSGFPETSRNRIPFFAGLNRYLVATIEENERAIAGALADQGFAAIDFLFGQDTEGPPQCAFGSKADRLYVNAARPLYPTRRTNAEASLNVCVGPEGRARRSILTRELRLYHRMASWLLQSP